MSVSLRRQIFSYKFNVAQGLGRVKNFRRACSVCWSELGVVESSSQSTVNS